MIKILYSIAAILMAGNAASAQEIGPRNLHRYAANHTVWNTNSYWIEGAGGVVLIDAQLLPSDARAVASQIKATGKPLAGVIVTHPHLDHYGGLAALRDAFGDFPVYASKATAERMAPTHKQMLGYYPMPNAFGEALDERFVGATHFLQDGETLTIAGIDLQVHDLGAGEAANNIALYQKDLDVLFAGDMFYPHTHYYVGEGNIDGALGHLEFIKENYGPTTHILPGHNDAARVPAADSQIAYIQALVDVTQQARSEDGALAGNGYLTAEKRAAVVREMRARFPGYNDFGFGVDQILTYNIMGIETYLIRSSQK